METKQVTFESGATREALPLRYDLCSPMAIECLIAYQIPDHAEALLLFLIETVGERGAATRWKQENAICKDSARRNIENDSNAIAMPCENDSNAIAMLQKKIARKEKERKVNMVPHQNLWVKK